MRHAFLLLAMLTCAAGVAHAQPAPGPVTASTSRRRSACCGGPLRAERRGLLLVGSAGFFKGLSVGHYWTDHLKRKSTSACGATEAYSYSNVRLANGSVASLSEERTYTGSKVSASQVYQFGRNVWFTLTFWGVWTSNASTSISSGAHSQHGSVPRGETSSSSSSVRAAW